MEIVECENHHFYNTSLYASCPQCEAQKQGVASLGATVPSIGSRIPPRGKSGIGSFFRSKDQNPEPVEPKQQEVADYGETLAVNNGFSPEFFQDSDAEIKESPQTDKEESEDGAVDNYGETLAAGQAFAADFFQNDKTESVEPGPNATAYGEIICKGVEDYDETLPARRSKAAGHAGEVEDYGETQPAGFNIEENFDPLAGWLICISGPDKGKDYRLHSGYNRIGRSLQSDVFLKSDVTVSMDGSGIIAYDPRGNRFYFGGGIGRNLSYVNYEVILGQTEIFAYDVITVGSTDLMFVPLCGKDFNWNKPIENDTEETDEI